MGQHPETGFWASGCDPRELNTDKSRTIQKGRSNRPPFNILQSIFSLAVRLQVGVVGKRPWKPRR